MDSTAAEPFTGITLWLSARISVLTLEWRGVHQTDGSIVNSAHTTKTIRLYNVYNFNEKVLIAGR